MGPGPVRSLQIEALIGTTAERGPLTANCGAQTCHGFHTFKGERHFPGVKVFSLRATDGLFTEVLFVC